MVTEEFLDILDKYAYAISKMANSYLKNKDDTEDIIQDVYLTYIKSKKIFKDEEHRKNWLLKVTKHKCINHMRKIKKNKFVELEENSAIYIPNNECMFVQDEISKLKDKYRVVFKLYYYEELKISEISKLLNISEDNVKTRLKRSRDKLKILLGKESFDEKFR